jgi:hypothetical protein
MSQDSSLTQSDRSVRQALTAYTDASRTAASRFLKKPFGDERLIDCLDWALKDPAPNTRQS